MERPRIPQSIALSRISPWIPSLETIDLLIAIVFLSPKLRQSFLMQNREIASHSCHEELSWSEMYSPNTALNLKMGDSEQIKSEP